jgi:hypothetical protein
VAAQGHLAWLILDVTIARFRARHEQALAGFLVESLKLCAPAGMVQVGTVARSAPPSSCC